MWSDFAFANLIESKIVLDQMRTTTGFKEAKAGLSLNNAANTDCQTT